jgi:hypothetical protein
MIGNRQLKGLRDSRKAAEKTIHTLHKAIGRSKYMPHQGAQEMARRVRQAEKIAAKVQDNGDTATNT